MARPVRIHLEGALYYVTYGLPWTGPPDTPAVHRIEYIGAVNAPPVVVVSAEPTDGAAPLAVQFSSAGTFDPDDGPEPLSFEWSFGDKATSDDSDPEHVYTAVGEYLATLTVCDGLAEITSDTITITVTVFGDLDGGGVVGTVDLLMLWGMWGGCADCDACGADLDGDCVVGTIDLLMMLGAWRG